MINVFNGQLALFLDRKTLVYNVPEISKDFQLSISRKNSLYLMLLIR